MNIDNNKERSRKRNMRIAILVSIVNVGLLVLLWTQLLTPRPNAQHSPDDPSLVGDVPGPLVGKSAPDFALPLVNSDKVTIHSSDFKGKAFILNFWASTCPPCQQETPFLQQEWPLLHAKGVTLLGVDEADTSQNALTFIQRYAMTYPNLKDTITGQMGVDYGVTGQPTTFFIDTKGVIVAQWQGPLSVQGLKQELLKMHIS